MSQKTMTRADLCEIVYRRIGLSRSDSAELIEAVLKEVTASLEEGEAVKLSAFGTFFIREKKERIGRNPKTGVEATIAGRRVVSFRASKVLKSYLNNE